MKRFCDDSACLNPSEYPGFRKCRRLEESVAANRNTNWNLVTGQQRPKSSAGHFHNHKCKHKHCCPETLVDLAAKVAAAHVPFELVEERYRRVPEPVVRKLITWSFPRCEADIRRYSAINVEPPASNFVNFDNDFQPLNSNNTEGQSENRSNSQINDNVSTSDDLGGQDITFRQGVTLATGGSVHKPMQIGFHLSGVVHEKVSDTSSCTFTSSTRTCDVAVTFDRCKVTSSTCNCRHGDGIFFCRHIVAVLIYRMRYPAKVKTRAPISDSLQQLSRDQLQKLMQYLLARHGHVLPTAQEIADKFCDPGSSINMLHGAPDPTAGAGYQDDDRWSLNEGHVIKHIRGLLHSNKHSSAQQIRNMMKKVREMLKVQDCNGPRLLTLITTELLKHGHQLPGQQCSKSFTELWDDIGLLWICVVLNPNGNQEQSKILKQLQDWTNDSRCPPEDDVTDFSTPASPGRTVLSRAIDAGSMNWNDPHLRTILGTKNGKPIFEPSQRNAEFNFLASHGGLTNFNSKGQPFWHEHTPLACVRVEALKSHGYSIQAVRLAVAIARTIKAKTIGQFRLYRKNRCEERDANAAERIDNVGLVNHPLNPVQILLETLTARCNPEQEEMLKTENQCTRASRRRDAFEISLLALGEERRMPQGARTQEKLVACEKQLIEKIGKIPLDDTLTRSICKITALLLDGGWKSGLGVHVDRDSLPMHAFAHYLFNAILPHDQTLAFRVGLRAMRMRVLDAHDDVKSGVGTNQVNINEGNAVPLQQEDQNPPVNGVPADEHDSEADPLRFTYPSSWTVMGDLEARQYDLASAMLQAAKGDVMLLRTIVESVQKHVRNATHVFQLSHDAFKIATASQSAATAADSTMLNVAMQLAMQVLQMTLQGPTWRRSEMVGWLIACASEIGLCALLSIIKTWYTLFTPVEACTMVAGFVISPNTAMKLNLDPRQRDELYQTVCQMAIQCAMKDPQSCALCSLTLSETFSKAFNEVYHVILDASNKKRIDSAQLYATARYLDQRGFHDRAFAMAFGATQRLRVPFNHDGHPAATDLLWTTQLAQSLGMKELEDLILVIVDKVRCASVLSDVLRTCTSSISGRMCVGNYGNRGLRADRPPLRPLLDASIAAYVSTIHSKLSHISPRHYTEFIDFLCKARDTFLMAPDGHVQFSRLLANLKTIYKGKKKLLNLVASRFG